MINELKVCMQAAQQEEFTKSTIMKSSFVDIIVRAGAGASVGEFPL